jgi:hypothetical protein
LAAATDSPCQRTLQEGDLERLPVVEVYRQPCESRPTRKAFQAPTIARQLGDGTFIAHDPKRGCFRGRFKACNKRCGRLPSVRVLRNWPVVPVYKYRCVSVRRENSPNPYIGPKRIHDLGDGTFIAEDSQRGCFRARYKSCRKKCLPPNTLIDTPNGPALVGHLRIGMSIYSRDTQGRRVVVPVEMMSCGGVSESHEVVEVSLSDGRRVVASIGHPLASGQGIESLGSGMVYDGAKVVSVERRLYSMPITRDLLPAGPTGIYWANEVPLGSTMHR